MLAASAYPYPFPPPHPQAGYQPSSNAIPISDVDRQRDLQRKRTYLSLLPPAQIIEICLNFEQYVPLHIRPSVWPADLDAAIQALQTSQQAEHVKADVPPQQQQHQQISSRPADASSATVSSASVASHQVHPPGIVPPVQAVEASFPTPASSPEKPSTPHPVPPPIIAHDPDRPQSPGLSLPTPSQPQTEPSQTSVQPAISVETTATVPTTEGTPTATVAEAHASPAPQSPISAPQADTAADTTSSTQAHTPTPQPQAQATAQAHSAPAPNQVPTPAHAPYPYAPYGYQQPYAPLPGTAPQTAYPHAPYYPPPGAPSTGYASHYPGYPPYPPPAPSYTQNTHQHQPPPPPPPPQAQGEDLPSYEDMIVEALSEIGDPDGAAPKDIFTWIGARWPLQMNFRPSASQALQKAFKRGRLEKRSGGRYRLNPAWEGGATSKRTTRRPQTLAQTTYALHHPPAQQNASPFTHAPLPHRAHTSPPPPPPPQHQPYPGYAYPYGGYGGYPGYPPYPGQPAAKTTAFKTTFQAKTASKTVPSEKEKDATSDEAGDAWEAAQHILQAINFGSLQNNVSQSTPSSSGTSSSALPPPVMASLDFNMDLGASSSTAAAPQPLALGEDGLGRATLTDEERASLQAQLALLAAQLSELAHEDEFAPAQSTAAPTPVPVEHADIQSRLQQQAQQQPQQQPQQIPQSHPQPQPAQAPQPQHPPAPPPPQPAPTPQAQQPPHPPPIIAQSSSMHAVLMDVNQFPDNSPTFASILQAHASSQPTTPKPHTPAPQPSTPALPSPSSPSEPPPVPSTPTPQPPPSEPAPEPSEDAGAHEEPSALPDDESDEDDDMEMVDVDSFMQSHVQA